MTAAADAEHGARLRRLATRASVAVALVLIAAKLAGYLLTGSVSLLSSLIDSSTDLMASLVSLVGVRHALRPADLSHRYGHGKAEPLAALVQSAFVAGSALLLTYEGIKRLIRPEPVLDGMFGIAVMVLAIVLTTGLVLFQMHVVRRTGSLAIGADSLHYRADLFTNMAVIVALLLTEATGWPLFDPIFALAIAAFLLRGAFVIARGSLDSLMDRELSAEDRLRIESIVLDHPQARGLHDLRTRSSGTSRFIELHLELDSHLTLEEAHIFTDEVENALATAFPDAEILIHQEPAGLDDERLDRRLMSEDGP